MKVLMFALAVFLLVASSSDACLGQRGGLRSRSRVTVVQQVTVAPVIVRQQAVIGCSSAVTIRSRMRVRSSGCGAAVMQVRGCSR